MKRVLVLALLLLAAPAWAQVPNESGLVRKLFDTGLYNLKTEAGQGAFVDAVVATLHAKDERWGHLKKNPGQSHIHGHGEDSVVYLSNTPGQSQAVDFIGGSGGPDPRPGWIVDEPRYSAKDWADPFDHKFRPAPPPAAPPAPPYPGDAVFDAVGDVLFADYAAAGQAPNPQMGRWFGRTIYDWIAGITKTLDESIAKHRKEWRAILGLP